MNQSELQDVSWGQTVRLCARCRSNHANSCCILLNCLICLLSKAAFRRPLLSCTEQVCEIVWVSESTPVWGSPIPLAVMVEAEDLGIKEKKTDGRQFVGICLSYDTSHTWQKMTICSPGVYLICLVSSTFYRQTLLEIKDLTHTSLCPSTPLLAPCPLSVTRGRAKRRCIRWEKRNKHTEKVRQGNIRDTRRGWTFSRPRRERRERRKSWEKVFLWLFWFHYFNWSFFLVRDRLTGHFMKTNTRPAVMEQ